MPLYIWEHILSGYLTHLVSKSLRSHDSNKMSSSGVTDLKETYYMPGTVHPKLALPCRICPARTSLSCAITITCDMLNTRITKPPLSCGVSSVQISSLIMNAYWHWLGLMNTPVVRTDGLPRYLSSSTHNFFLWIFSPYENRKNLLSTPHHYDIRHLRPYGTFRNNARS